MFDVVGEHVYDSADTEDAFECEGRCGHGHGFGEIGVAPTLDTDERCAVAAGVADEVGDVMDGLDLGPEPLVAAGASASSSSGHAAPSEGVVAPEPTTAITDVEPWTRFGEPGVTGYLYLDGRSILRIQRGRPKHSTTISCYHNHGRCQLTIGESKATNDEIKRWAFEVAPGSTESTAAERRELGERHMAIGRARWYAAIK